MSLIDNSTNSVLNVQVDLAYSKAYTVAESDAVAIERLARKVEGNGSKLEIPFAYTNDSLKQLFDSKLSTNVFKNNITISAFPFYKKIEISKFDVDDDRFGLYQPQFEDLGRAARLFPSKLIQRQLRAGDGSLASLPGLNPREVTTLNNSAICIKDGLSLLNTAHLIDPNGASVAGNTFSNNLTSDLGTLTATHLETALNKMAGFVAPNGENLEMRATDLVVGTNVYFTALGIVGSNVLLSGGGNTNIHAGSLKITVCPHLHPDSWYIMDLSKVSMMPLIFWPRQEPVLTPANTVNFSDVLEKMVYSYHVDARFGVSAGIPEAVIAGNHV